MTAAVKTFTIARRARLRWCPAMAGPNVLSFRTCGSARHRQVFFDPTDVTRSLVAFVQFGAARLRESDYELGSPISTVALEMSHVAPGIRTACVEAHRTWRATLVEFLTPQLGEVAAAETTSLFLSAFEGAMLLARTERTTVPLDELQDLVPRLIKPAGG